MDGSNSFLPQRFTVFVCLERTVFSFCDGSNNCIRYGSQFCMVTLMYLHTSHPGAFLLPAPNRIFSYHILHHRKNLLVRKIHLHECALLHRHGQDKFDVRCTFRTSRILLFPYGVILIPKRPYLSSTSKFLHGFGS